jgi:hypothetical protein
MRWFRECDPYLELEIHDKSVETKENVYHYTTKEELFLWL